MLLEKKNAVIYGAAGAIGSAVARTFAREGARVFLAGRTLAKLDALAKDIRSAGGTADTAQVDALDDRAVDAHADEVMRKTGSIDVSLNVISIDNVHGTPLADLTVQDFTDPITDFARTHFLTAKAAAQRMIKRKSGVILMVTASPARMAFPLVGAFGVACAGIEAFARTLAAEVGPRGVRVVCLLSSGSPEAPGVQEAFDFHAKASGRTREQFEADLKQRSMLRQMTSLADVANAAAFVASDRAGAITGTVVNLSCGSIVD